MIFKKFLLVLVMMLLVISLIQMKTPVFTEKNLYGYFPVDEMTPRTWETWFNSTFQTKFSQQFNQNIGFRKSLVRLYNQIDFSLFRIPHAQNIVVGKKDYLLAHSYIKAFLGKDFAGKPGIDRIVNQTRILQDRLEQTMKVHLLVLFAPDKVSFYPDMIPERFLKGKKSVSNYTYTVERCKAEGVNFIDCNSWFLKMKDTCPYVLYPKTGIHWSTYGATLVADSLSKYLKAKFSLDMPKMVINSVEMSDTARFEDNDIGKTLNLIIPLSYPPLAYPLISYISGNSKPKPRVLFVGDSFYWEFLYLNFIDSAFCNKDFWLYNQEVYPGTSDGPLSIHQIATLDIIRAQDLVVLIQTNAGYGNPGYGFVQQTLEDLNSFSNRLKEIEASIWNNRKWLDQVKVKAGKRNIPLENQVREDALFMMNREVTNSKNK